MGYRRTTVEGMSLSEFGTLQGRRGIGYAVIGEQTLTGNAMTLGITE